MDSWKSGLRGTSNSIGYHHHHHHRRRGARPKCIAPLFLLPSSFGTPLLFLLHTAAHSIIDEREGAKREEEEEWEWDRALRSVLEMNYSGEEETERMPPLCVWK